MRTRPVLAILAGLALGCGFLKSSKSSSTTASSTTTAPSAPAAAPATPVPFERQEGSGLAFGEQRRETSNKVQNPNETVVQPKIPDGVTLAPVKTDYEYLHDTGVIDACPDSTTLTESKSGDTHTSYCALSNGVRHGPWINYWSNGQVKEIGPYVGGFRNGTFTTWNAKGQLSSRYTWTNGQPGTGQIFTGQ